MGENDTLRDRADPEEEIDALHVAEKVGLLVPLGLEEGVNVSFREQVQLEDCDSLGVVDNEREDVGVPVEDHVGPDGVCDRDAECDGVDVADVEAESLRAVDDHVRVGTTLTDPLLLAVRVEEELGVRVAVAAELREHDAEGGLWLEVPSVLLVAVVLGDPEGVQVSVGASVSEDDGVPVLLALHVRDQEARVSENVDVAI